jgi:hypothetical protein
VAWYVVPLIWVALIYVWPDPTPEELAVWLAPVAARHQLQLDRRRQLQQQADPRQVLAAPANVPPPMAVAVPGAGASTGSSISLVASKDSGRRSIVSISA